MKLFSTSLFANFLAGTYTYIPNPPKINQGLWQEIRYISAEGWSRNQQLWVFGAYDLTVPDNCSVTWFDFPTDQYLGRGRFVPLIVDNWAATVDELYSRASDQPCVFLLTSEYLSGLVDPRPLLLALKRLSLHNGSSAVVIYTPEKKGIRHWTEAEFKDFLLASGFELTELSREPLGVVLDCRIAPLGYQHYLENLGLLPSTLQADFLLVSTEDASLKPTGGIGTYVANLKRFNAGCVTLFCDLDSSVEARDGRTILVRTAIEHLSWEQLIDGHGLIEAIKIVLFTLPNIRVCEFQDYQSLGFRVVQAKQTGVLPQSLWLRLFLHGSVDHLKFGEQNEKTSNYSVDELKLTIKDNYTFKNVDECWVPSKYLANLLQEEFGHQLSNPTIRRLPFDAAALPQLLTVQFSEIRKIIFLGKYTGLKGWQDFQAALALLDGQQVLNGIQEIISVGPGEPSEDEIHRLSEIKNYRWLSFNHADFIQFVLDNRQDALFVVPSRGESYSYVVLEQLLLGTRFVAYNAGGTIEVVDDEQYIQCFFSDPLPKALAQKIEEILKLPVDSYEGIIYEKSRQIFQRQCEVNNTYKTTSPCTLGLEQREWDWAAAIEITVSTPVYNTPIHYLQDLFKSILGSQLRPKEWLLIDDGSKDSYHQELLCFAEDCQAFLPVRVIRQENKGLAGARNSSLVASNSKYTFLIDSDDVLLPQTLSDAFVAMQSDGSLVATTGFPINFSELTDLPGDLSPIHFGWYWKPLGIPEARALSLYENQFISASVFVHTDKVRAVGGWDQSDRSTWEDWAFYTKLAWSEEHFGLIPSPGYLYRNTPGSMSKTYNRYFGRRRLIRNIQAFSRLDANVILSLIHASTSNPDLVAETYHNNELALSPKEIKLISLVRKIKGNRLCLFFLKLYSLFSKLTSKKDTNSAGGKVD